MQISLNELFFINNHVITQIIETVLVVGDVSDIAVILFTSLFTVHGIQYTSNGQTKKLMDFSHPLRISTCQIIIDRYYMNSFSFQSVQICR